jgi:uncharacterized protein (DUF3820 family)
METIICQKCGLINDYAVQQSGPHKTAYCNGCGKYIKHITQGNDFEIPFGRYKGRMLSSMVSSEEINYLKWLLLQDVKNSLRTKLQTHIDKCN